ncbi:MAG: protoglobin domain-containing protein [Acidimicrobiales bacterium]
MNDHDLAELRAEMNLNRHELDQRKAWLGLDQDDVKLLGEMDDLVDPHVGDIVKALTAELVAGRNGGPRTDEDAQRVLRQYFGGLTSGGAMDEGFVDRRLAIAAALRDHVSADVSWYLAAYLFYLNQVAARLREMSGDLTGMQAMYRTLAKVLFLDLGLAIDSYLFERDRTIRSQQRELEELSTPVLQLRPGLLILPIIGMLDARRAQQLTEQLLHAIRARRGKVVVLDVTGVAAVDSRVANHLIQTVDAARLMGATAIVTGVSPEVAQTLVGLGISLGNVTTVADLQGGIEEADRLLGLRVVAADGEGPASGPP